MKQVRSRGLLLLLPVLLAMMAGIVLYASPLKLNPPLTNATIDEAIFTPDSQHIIYRIKYQDDKSAAIYRVPVMGGESVQLSTRDLDTWFAKPSQFIPSISPDGAYLLYRSNQDEAEVLELFSVPTNGVVSDSVKLNGDLVAGGNVAPYNFTHMQISPTSDRAAYIADQEIDEKQELYSVPIDGPASAGVKLNAPLLPAEDVLEFQFTPDGQYVVYMAKCASCGSTGKAIYAVPSVGPATAAVNLTAALETGGTLSDFKITPDSKNLLFSRVDQSGSANLYKTSLSGATDPILVTTRTIYDYDISADGSFVVFSSFPSYRFVPELYRVPFATSPAGEIKLNHNMVEGGMVLQFIITPDSRRVVYHASDTASQTFGLFVASLDGLDPIVKLNDFPIVSWGTYPYHISSNSQYVIYPNDDRSVFYSVPLMGPSDATVRLTTELPAHGSIGPYSLTPDNRLFLYTADIEVDGAYDLYQVPITGPAAVAVKINGPLAEGGSVWRLKVGPYGRNVLYVADEEVTGIRDLYVNEIGPSLDHKLFLPIIAH